MCKSFKCIVPLLEIVFSRKFETRDKTTLKALLILKHVYPIK